MTLEIRQDQGFNNFRRDLNAMTCPNSVIDALISTAWFGITKSGYVYKSSLNTFKNLKEIKFSSFKSYSSVSSALDYLNNTRELLFKTLGTLDGCHEVLKSSIRLINPTVLYLGLGTGLTTIGLIGILFSSWLQEKKIAKQEKDDSEVKGSNTLTSKMSPVKIRNISVVLAFAGLALSAVTITHLWMSGKAYRAFLLTGCIDSHGVKKDIAKVLKQEAILSDTAPSGQDLEEELYFTPERISNIIASSARRCIC